MSVFFFVKSFLLDCSRVVPGRNVAYTALNNTSDPDESSEIKPKNLYYLAVAENIHCLLKLGRLRTSNTGTTSICELSKIAGSEGS